MSTRHQCIKFPHLGKIIKLMGDPPVIEPEELQILPTLQPAPISYGVKVHGYKIDPVVSLTDIDSGRSMILDPVPLPEPLLRKECIQGWNLMRKLGYQPGLGLGKNEAGILDHVISEMKIGIGGLGFNSYNQIARCRENWTLKEHFTKHTKLLDPNEPPDGGGCYEVHPQKKGKELLIEDIANSSSEDEEVESYEDVLGTWEGFQESEAIRGSSPSLEESF